jgi:Mechanosensitive ion channel
VVVRIWDRRRLVLPCSYFVERPIQNWTRYSSDIVGTVVLHVDYTTPVDAVRAEFQRVLAASKLSNGQTAVLQVVDTTERTMVLRALVSADSAPSTWDLRCEVLGAAAGLAAGPAAGGAAPGPGRAGATGPGRPGCGRPRSRRRPGSVDCGLTASPATGGTDPA